MYRQNFQITNNPWSSILNNDQRHNKFHNILSINPKPRIVLPEQLKQAYETSRAYAQYTN